MRPLIQPIFNLLTTFVLVCALIAVGFAHKSTNTILSPELADYIAAGGSISDICGTSHETGHAGVVDCEACRIVDTFVDTRDLDTKPVDLEGQTRACQFIATQIAHRQTLDPARLTRAPPIS